MSTHTSPADDPQLSRRLTDAEENYVFSHLEEHISTARPLREILNFPRSEGPLRKDFRIGDVPVLFPLSDDATPYKADGDKVTLSHDFIKSAFYLLSAYQEWATDKRDAWGRFSYDDSIQKELDIARKPIVNQYFNWIIEAIETQCKQSGIEYKRLSPLDGPRVHLSHDIDTAHYFTLRKALFRCAQVIGLRPCDTDRRRLLRAAVRSLLHCARIDKSADPYWSFDTIQDNEVFMGYRSHWFFLPDDGGPFGPDYKLTDKDICDVIRQLRERGNTVGLHAPINTKSSEEYTTLLKVVSEVTDNTLPTACRQHFLAIEPRSSMREMSKAGIRQDFSMGFSAHEGFRTSYCHPYRPFDHEAQKPIDIIEVPLAMMDTTVLSHRKLSYDEIYYAMGEMIDEVRKYSGVFSILWHNSTFDEVYHPGVTKFYEGMMTMLSQYQLRSL